METNIFKSFKLKKICLIPIFRVFSLVFIESNKNLRQHHKCMNNFIGKEKNFAEEFHLRCFFCSHFLLLVTRFLDAQLKEEAFERIRLHRILQDYA